MLRRNKVAPRNDVTLEEYYIAQVDASIASNGSLGTAYLLGIYQGRSRKSEGAHLFRLISPQYSRIHNRTVECEGNPSRN